MENNNKTHLDKVKKDRMILFVFLGVMVVVASIVTVLTVKEL